MTVFSLWHPEHQGFAVDLFLQEPFEFDAAYRRALVVPIREIEVTVLSLADLIEMKQAVGRPEDLIGVKALRELSGLQRAEE